MTHEEIQKAAYAHWEAEGRPEGQHERHWREAEDEIASTSHNDDHVLPSEDAGATSSEAIPARGNGREGFKPGELASENK